MNPDRKAALKVDVQQAYNPLEAIWATTASNLERSRMAAVVVMGIVGVLKQYPECSAVVIKGLGMNGKEISHKITSQLVPAAEGQEQPEVVVDKMRVLTTDDDGEPVDDTKNRIPELPQEYIQIGASLLEEIANFKGWEIEERVA